MKITIPYNFEGLFQELEHPAPRQRLKQNYDIKETEASISQFLEMLLLTKCGEYYLDRKFGFKFWDHLFNNISIENFKSNMIFQISDVRYKDSDLRREKSDLKKNDYIKLLKDVIEKYETRLTDVNINLNIETEIHSNNLLKYLVLTISGKIDNHEQYKKEFKLIIGPIEKKY